MKLTFQRLLQRKMVWILLLAIVTVRLTIFCTVKDIDTTIPVNLQDYMKYYYIPQLSILFTPLYCFWIFDTAPLFFNAGFLLRTGGRSRLALEYGKHTLVGALSYTLVLQITAIAFTIGRIGFFSLYPDLVLYYTLSLFLYFSVCSILYFICYLLTRSAAVCFILVTLYGAADFIGTYTFTGNWFSLGVIRIYPPDISDYVKHHTLAFSNLQFLIAVIITLSVICVLLLHKTDFLRKNEGDEDV